MNKVLVVIAGLLFAICTLNALSNFGLVSNGFEPSAINLAMGGSPVGAVNYWHNDPLTAYDNPAFPALHKGISYSSTKYVFMTLYPRPDVSEELAYRSSMMSAAYYGIGLLFPTNLSNSGRASTHIDYGEQQFTDGSFEVQNANLYDQSDSYGLSINLPEVYERLNPKAGSIANMVDFSVGISHQLHESNLLNRKIDANSTNWGYLLKLKHTYRPNLKLEAALGGSSFNALKDEIDFGLGTSPVRIYQRSSMGVALSFMKTNPHYAKDSSITSSFANLYSARILCGNIREYARPKYIAGLGGELGIFDTAFLRVGYHNDEEGNIKGLTYGIGINAHFRDLVSITYNYSFFTGGILNEDKEITNYGLSVNVMQILRGL
jgi:hypothetical protein